MFRLLTILLFATYGHWNMPFATAESSTVAWSEPINLSSSLVSSDNPTIVADGYGYVHVFWSEEVDGKLLGPNDQHRAGNTILYTRWDGISWTTPIDILFVPGDDIAEFIAVTVDAHNRLHAVWTGQSNIYYSNAPANQATSARAWSEPMVIARGSARSQWESAVVVDSSDNVHIFYATGSNDPGIYHTISRDNGIGWETPVKLSSPLDASERGLSSVRGTLDGAGRLHVVWSTFQENGYGQAVYYARSTDGGESWSTPVQLGYRDPGDFEASYPYLASVSDSELHLVYLDGATSGRSQRISRDGGTTWSEPLHIIDELEGVNGYVIPLVDSTGQLHLVANMRTRARQVVGIYYAYQTGSSWSPVVPVDVRSQGAPTAHHAAATVRLGNELHVVYNQFAGGEIWYVRGVLKDTPAMPTLVSSPPRLLAASTPSLAPSATPEATATSVVKKGASVAGFDRDSQQTTGSPDPLTALFGGMGSAMLVVGGVIAWTRWRARRHFQP